MSRLSDIRGNNFSIKRVEVHLSVSILACLVILFLALPSPADADIIKNEDGSQVPDPRMVFGKIARVDVRDKDRYGRLVGWVRVGSTDVNLAIVRAGFA